MAKGINNGEARVGKRGFASMSSQQQRDIARKGGRAAHQKGTAHEFSSDEARAAGRKGGERVSSNRQHMAEIGRMGGLSSAGRRSTPPDGASHIEKGAELTPHSSAGTESSSGKFESLVDEDLSESDGSATGVVLPNPPSYPSATR